MRYLILLLIIQLFSIGSCTVSKPINTSSVTIIQDKNSIKNDTLEITDTIALLQCFKKEGVKFEQKILEKEMYSLKKFEYMEIALCLHNEVKNGNTSAGLIYWKVMDHAVHDWVRNGLNRAYLVDSMAQLKTTTSFDYLVKFLDVNTGHGSYDEVYQHDGWNLWNLIFNYLEENQKKQYSNNNTNIWHSIYNIHYKKYGKEPLDLGLPEAHKKCREIFLADYRSGKIKLKTEIREDKK